MAAFQINQLTADPIKPNGRYVPECYIDELLAQG
jgi:hypothetical protein